MQHLNLGQAGLRAYHDHLHSDHDFWVWAEILTMDEKFVGEAELLDGQINLAGSTSDGPDRTASVVLSDPERALSFGTAYADDPDGVVWVNRLIRVRHKVVVPSLGPVLTTAMVGAPTSVAHTGAEVGLELADKSILADHGVRPRTYKRGARVDLVLRSIFTDLCGEARVRVPTTKKRLSRPYTAGMGDDALTPWALAKRVAGREAGWRVFYSADGYATAEPSAAHRHGLDVPYLLNVPDSSTSFTDFVNYVKVTSHRKPRNKKGQEKKKNSNVTLVYESVATLPPKHQLSESILGRNGVPRTLPLVVSDDSLKTARAVSDRARAEMKGGSGLEAENSFEIMPLFHLDVGDKLRLPAGAGDVTLKEASIPLGVGGNMTLGRTRWVSRPVRVRRVRSKTTVVRRKKKGGKGNG